ncbi:LamB/YcsF family protein [Vreelandella azerica]|uniref:LamB/YcsF family protein n=1 Tax=Vreelandella azerica TaxID=2732867 RepID=UPI001C11892F|nr:LamB/YcsF family protein [Halomonas azerica]
MRTLQLNADMGESFGPWVMGLDHEVIAICTGSLPLPMTVKPTLVDLVPSETTLLAPARTRNTTPFPPSSSQYMERILDAESLNPSGVYDCVKILSGQNNAKL